MVNVAALKKKAADFEQKKQLDKAIATYREVLDAYDAGGGENVDVGLYNRVGDLLVRQGSTADAVTLYERAVDLYAEGGFFNNAIALCNKILRTSPGRATVYYKLGKISAAKGFKADAKQNFLEYADRMQKSGQIPEAFRALKEFADLCPDQDDIRLMLAEQLTKADKKPEALEQLQLLYARYEFEGRTTEAQATVERMRAIDPTAEAKSGGARATTRPDDELVFIDLNAPTPRATRRTRAVTALPPEPPPPPLEIEVVPTAQKPPPAPEPTPVGGMVGLETTAISEPVPVEPAPMQASEFAEIDLSTIPEAQSPSERTSERDLALAGDLPMIDTSTPGDMPRISLALDVDVTSGLSDLPMIDVTPTPADVPLLDLEPTAVVEETPGDAGGAADLDLGSLDEAAEELPAADVEQLAEAAPETPTAYGAVEIDSVEAPPPVRRTSSLLPHSAAMLAVRLEEEPQNWNLHREYAEALLEEGNRDAGLKELEKALVGLEKSDDLESARSVAEEIIRLNPGSVRHHQKRVEYAFRSNDKPRLLEAYIELADALFRDGQAAQAKKVYMRVLEIAPDEARASAALESFGPEPVPEPEAPPAQKPQPHLSRKTRRYTGTMEVMKTTIEAPVAPKAPDEEFVSLGDWLREDEGPKSTRMVVEEEQPSGDEAADFADMLKKFKQGVAENVEEEDHESHYDLGVAFKEMGLIDEAIVEFQKALRGPQHRVRTCEALGQCFLEKKQLPMARTVLQRALNEPGADDDQLVGVLYLLGYTNETLGNFADAKGFYERVFSVDIQFRDVGDRLNAVEKALK
jgi:tetratricopeptide (TPR) repeat protein